MCLWPSYMSASRCFSVVALRIIVWSCAHAVVLMLLCSCCCTHAVVLMPLCAAMPPLLIPARSSVSEDDDDDTMEAVAVTIKIVKAIATEQRDELRECIACAPRSVINAHIEPLGWTPLHVAAATGNVGILKMLLDKGADPSKSATSDGSTPLLIAIQHGFQDVALALLERSPATATVADTAHGMTPLMCACQHADVNAINMLLSHVPRVARMSFISKPNRYARCHRLVQHPTYTSPFSLLVSLFPCLTSWSSCVRARFLCGLLAAWAFGLRQVRDVSLDVCLLRCGSRLGAQVDAVPCGPRRRRHWGRGSRGP